MTLPICSGTIKIPKKLIAEGMDDKCNNFGTEYCEDCGRNFCHKHINRDKHKCDDSIQGCHGVLKGA